MDSVKDPTTGRLYKQEMSFCGKERCKKCARGEGHGPYWYAYWWEDGKTRKKYVGKNLPASLTQDLHKTDPLTQDSEKSYVRTEEETLHKTTKTRKKALPKTDGSAVEKAIEAIGDFHHQGIEPTVAQVAEVVGTKSRPLGRLLKAEGMEAVNVRRDGVRARRYTFELKEKIEGTLEG